MIDEEETQERRDTLLRALKQRDRELIERLLIQHPGLTAAEAIQYCSEMGGLGLSGTAVRKLLGLAERGDE